MDLMAMALALKARKMNSAEFQAAVEQYLEDNPDAVDQAALEAILDGRLDGIEGDLGGLKSEIQDTRNLIKVHHQEFTVEANHGHSSADDKLMVNIPSGTEYTLVVSASGATSGTMTPREWYDETNYTAFTARALPTSWDFVAQNDVVAIGIYFTSSFVASTTTFSVDLYINGNIYDDISIQSGRLDGVADETKSLFDTVFDSTSISGYKTTGRRLGRNSGYGYADANYNGRSFAVIAGDIIQIESVDRFQFQDAGGIFLPSTAAYHRIGNTYGAGIYFMRVPTGATHVVASYLASGAEPHVYKAVNSRLDEHDQRINFVNEYIRYYKKVFTAPASTAHSSSLDQISVNIPNGTEYTIKASVGSAKTGNISCYEWYDASNSRAIGAATSLPNTWNATAEGNVSAIGLYFGASYLAEDTTFTVEVFVRGGLSGDIADLDDRVTALENSHAYDVPEFLQNEFDSTVVTLRDECNERCYVICFVTDTHYGFNGHGASNWPTTISVIRAVNNAYPIDALVHGGDYSNGDVAKSETIFINEGIRRDIIKAVADCFFLVGNHDDNHFYDDGSEIIDEGERHALYSRSFGKKAFDPYGKGYFYFDVPTLGIRIIGLNCIDDTNSVSFSVEQIAWVRDVALDTDYQVAFFCHEPVTREYNYNNAQVGNGVELRAIIESFIAGGGTVIGYFHGHTHWDNIGKKSETNGFYECSTCCSKEEHSAAPSYLPSGVTWYTRTHETASQECIDFIVIKPDTRKVKLVRFGVGSDREILY